jgi:hypothetical protein
MKYIIAKTNQCTTFLTHSAFVNIAVSLRTNASLYEIKDDIIKEFGRIILESQEKEIVFAPEEYYDAPF